MGEGDSDDEREEEADGGDNIFGRVKQIDVHAQVGDCEGIVVSHRHRRR